MSAMEVTEHDKSKRNANAKMAVLPSDDPRCHGLEEGFCRMACDTCPFVTRPIKNEYLNKWRRQQAADKAHKVPSDAAEQPVQQSLARRRASQETVDMLSERQCTAWPEHKGANACRANAKGSSSSRLMLPAQSG